VEPSPSTGISHPEKANITAIAAIIRQPLAVLIKAPPIQAG
jgi:hypothetical protein